MARDAPATPTTEASVRVVTLSAAYGAGASVVGPAVAERLGLPYLERVLTPALLRASADAVGDDTPRDERSGRFLSRIVESLAGMPQALAGAPEPTGAVAEEQVRGELEASIDALTRPPGGVVRGRGATAVLASCPTAFHVQLSGPREARIRQAMQLTHIDEAEAARRCKETDRARHLYLRRFYDVDADDPALYHLTLDSTAVPLPTCVDVIVEAASAFWRMRA